MKEITVHTSTDDGQDQHDQVHHQEPNALSQNIWSKYQDMYIMFTNQKEEQMLKWSVFKTETKQLKCL